MRLGRKSSERVFIKFLEKDCGRDESFVMRASERFADQSSSIVPSREKLYAKVIQMLSATLIFAKPTLFTIH